VKELFFLQEGHMTKGKKAAAIVAAVVVVICCALGVWYLHYRKSPAYSLTMAAESVEKHDWATFEKYVDTASVIDHFYYDAVKETLRESDFSPAMQGVALQMADSLKPRVVDGLNYMVRTYVEQGSVNEAVVPKQEGSLVNPIPYRMLGGLAHLTGKLETKEDDDGATVTTSIHDDRVGADFPIVIRMKKNDDGSWKAVSWENAGDFMRQWHEAEQTALASLNAPIEDQLTQLVKIDSLSGRVEPADTLGLTQQLRFTIDGTVKSDKPVAEIDGYVKASTPEGVSVMASFEQHLEGLTNGTVKWDMARELSPFVQSDLTIMQAKSLMWEGKITKVVFGDGTKIETYKELPEKK
jgi:hypothetical protein